MNFAASVRSSTVIGFVVSSVLVPSVLVSSFVVSGLVLSSIALIGVMAPAASGQTTGSESTVTVDFDDYPANRVGTPAATGVTDFYRGSGLVFIEPVTALVYNKDSAPADPDFPRSGSTVITTCYAAEFCTNDIRMQLLTPHQRVRLFVGYDGRLSSTATLLLLGFDQDQNLVARTAVDLGPNELRIPVDIPMSIEDPDGRLRSLQLRWSDERSFLSGLSVDDIELTPFVVAATAGFEPDSIRLDGSEGAVEEQVRLINTGNVDIDVASVELTVDGSQPSGELAIDPSNCVGRLGRDASCVITINFAAADNGVRFAELTARGPSGRPLAVATIEAVSDVAVETTDPTIDPESTGPDGSPDPTDSPGQTTAPEGGGQDPTPPAPTVEPQREITPETIGALVLIVVILGLMIRLIRRFIKRPPDLRDRPPRPSPRPKLQVRSDPGTQELDGGGRPMVTIRASIHLDDGRTTITDAGTPTAGVGVTTRSTTEGTAS